MTPDCGCSELEWDLMDHGVHYCYEGQRLDPEKVVRVLDHDAPGPVVSDSFLVGYWSRVRRLFPDTFQRIAQLEREIGRPMLSDPDGPAWLDELDPEGGKD